MIQSNSAEFSAMSGIQELNFAEIDMIAGASEWGENVVFYASAGALLGSFSGNPAGTAAGALIGAAVGTVVTVLSDDD